MPLIVVMMVEMVSDVWNNVEEDGVTIEDNEEDCSACEEIPKVSEAPVRGAFELEGTFVPE